VAIIERSHTATAAVVGSNGRGGGGGNSDAGEAPDLAPSDAQSCRCPVHPLRRHAWEEACVRRVLRRAAIERIGARADADNQRTPWVAARDFCAAFARDDQLHTTLRSGDADALPCDSTAFPEVQLSA